MKNLTLFSANKAKSIAHPPLFKAISANDSALEIFTDFTRTPALLVDASLSAEQAEALMQSTHVRMKIVVDKRDGVLGIISLDNLNSQEMIKRISQGYRRSDLKVTDFMQPLSNLKAFSWEQLQDASIQDVIETLQNSGQQHCLVIDDQQHEIRGIISASDIARKLKLPLDIQKESSFARISHVIYQQVHQRPLLVSNG